MRLGCVCWRFGDEIGDWFATRTRDILLLYEASVQINGGNGLRAASALLVRAMFASKISPLDVFAHATLRTFLPSNSFGKQKRRNEVDTTDGT